MLRKIVCMLILCMSAHTLAALPVETAQAEYYGETGCSHCDDFTDKVLPAAEKESGISADIKVYDVLSGEGYTRCETQLEEMGYEFTIFPVLIIGNNAYQGNTAIEENLVSELRYFAEHGHYRPRIKSGEKPNTERRGMELAFIPIFLAGLIDGINPCAFTTLLFFISFVTLRGRTKKETALLGLLFAAGIFIAYFFIGLGLFNLLRASLNFNAVRLTLKIVVTLLTAFFCAFTIRDYILIRRGHTDKVFLHLPGTVKKKIHASIRKGTGLALFSVGVFTTGIVVAVLELACTGQIYFPTISFMVQTDATWLGLGSLFLYNFAFIIPLLVVLGLVLFGIRHERVVSFFRARLGTAKLITAVLFAVLASLVWLF